MGRRWRTAVLGTLAAALCATTLATGASASASASGATVQVHALTRNPVVTGYTWVTFGRGGYTNATIRGSVNGVASGAIARLYAQRFPFRAAPAPITYATLTLNGASAAYSFTVTPALATRYRVRIFAAASSPTPEASSRLLTVYTATNGVGSSANSCDASKCTLTVRLTYVVPTVAIGVERHKHQFAYLDLPRAPDALQPAPTTYVRVGAKVSAPKVTGHDVRYTITISYAKPSYSYWYYWQVCDRDSVNRDGLGLPGRHGCGNRTLAATSTYVG